MVRPLDMRVTMRRVFQTLTSLAVLPLMGAMNPTAGADGPSGAICHTEAPDTVAGPARALLAGYGTGGFLIKTNNPDAQAYFNNGMQLAHAFAHKAATSAFKRAEQLDPTCAMCVWGEAWSRGPTINYSIDKDEERETLALADKAAVLASDGPPKERALVAALQARPHSGGGRGRGDEAFAKAMDDLWRSHPDDNEIAVIAADAWLIAAAGRDHDQRIKRALDILEPALTRAPNDTGLIHFYIHATEMGGVGVRALPYAQKLEALAPAASHLVHMPSHTYFWAGWYQKAEQSNLDAVRIDRAEAARHPPSGGLFSIRYFGHNVQYGAGSALMDGDAKGALALASTQLAEPLPGRTSNIYQQVALGTAYFAYGRYASQDHVAALSDPGSDLPFARAMWRYARGEAAARKGDAGAVKAEAKALAVTPADAKSFGNFAPQAQAMVVVARLVLAGRAAMLDKRWRDAEAAYRQAADLQEAVLGEISDPPAWWYPVRRSFAAALLADGRVDDAAAQARKAMVRWPSDPVSLKVLAQSEAVESRADDAKRHMSLAEANWAGDLSQVSPALM